ncbi:MFS transporter [Phaeovulum sp. W22_SRMD_FR3]|uniref:MFS transporter n=1 Tax=Phaeovulum sp. W22_SRMD_FR3 TaxID=3240274 RepID=UPI003F9481A7
MSNRTAILAIIVLTYVMIVLDISIVLTGLPRIEAELGFTEAGLSWVSTAYTLCFGGFLLLGARLGDVFGRRRMFLIGLSVFGFASLLIGFAQGPGMLVAARALQGMGAAVLAPSTLALLQVTFRPGPERTRALAAHAAAAGVSASFGLVLGGVLADLVSWRAGFFLNLPVSLGLALAALRHVSDTDTQGGLIDLPGAATSTFGIGALVYGMIHAATAGWQDAVTLAAVAAGAVSLALFILGQSRAAQPLLPLRLFASRARSGAYLARVLFLGANVSFYFFMSQYFQQGLGYSALTTGLAFLPTTLVNFAAALSGPRLIARFGGGAVLIASLATSLIGFVGLALITPDSGFWLGLMLPMVFLGFGQGGALAPLTAAGISGAAANDAGAASGVVNVAHQIGSSLGLGVLISVAAPAGGIIARTAHAMTGGAVMIALTVAVALAFGLVTRRHTVVAS